MSFSNIFTQVAVLFILILVGYFIRRLELLDDESTSKISNLAMSVFLPAMIIDSMQIDFNSTMVNKILLLLLVSVVAYAVSIALAFLLKFAFKNDSDIGIYQYVIIFSNVAFMGYPVVEAVLGKEAIFYTAIYNLPFNLFTFTIGIYLLSKGNSDYKFSAKSLISPATISIVFGLTLFITGLRLPAFLNNSLSLLGGVTTPISMLVIGSMLANSSAKECFYNKKLYLVTFIRLILLPLAVFFLLNNRVEDSMIAAIPIVMTSMPAAANTAIMANQYGSNITLASQCVFLTTLFSVFTIPIINMFLLGWFILWCIVQ